MSAPEFGRIGKQEEGNSNLEISASRVLAELHKDIPTLNLRQVEDLVAEIQRTNEIPEVSIGQLKGIFYELAKRVVRRVWDSAEPWIKENPPGIGYTHFGTTLKPGDLISYGSRPDKLENLERQVRDSRTPYEAGKVLSLSTSKTFGFFVKSYAQNEKRQKQKFRELPADQQQEVLDYELYDRILSFRTKINLPSPARNSWPVEDMLTGFETQNSNEWGVYAMIPGLFKARFPGQQLTDENFARICDSSLDISLLLSTVHQDGVGSVQEYLITTLGSSEGRLDPNKFELVGGPDNCVVQIKGQPLKVHVEKTNLKAQLDPSLPRIGCPAHLARNPQTRDSVIHEIHKQLFIPTAKALFIPNLKKFTTN